MRQTREPYWEMRVAPVASRTKQAMNSKPTKLRVRPQANARRVFASRNTKGRIMIALLDVKGLRHSCLNRNLQMRLFRLLPRGLSLAGFHACQQLNAHYGCELVP